MYVLLFLKLLLVFSLFHFFSVVFRNIEYLLFHVWYVKFNIPSSSFSSSSFFYQFCYSKWNKWGEIDFSSKNKKQKDGEGYEGGEGGGCINVIYYMMMITHWKCSIFYKIRILLYIQFHSTSSSISAFLSTSGKMLSPFEIGFHSNLEWHDLLSGECSAQRT